MTRKSPSLVVSIGIAALLGGASPALAQTAPPLNTVQSFAVLGGSGVTAAGGAGTVVAGDVGSAPTPAVTGFPPAVVTAGFTVYLAANAVTGQARIDATSARVNLAGQLCPAANIIAGGVLGGRNLVPGVYCMPTGDLTGTLTLTGGAADVWVFQITLDTLTTAGASQVLMAGGASACNVYWQVSSSATLGSASTFRGSIFSGVSIGVGTTANVIGRTIAGSGAVTLDGSNTIGGCSAPAAPPPPPPPPPPVCPTITFTPTTVPGGTVGVAYTQTFTGSGGNEPYRFGVSSGALPTGLVLSTTSPGILSGTPTTVGTFNFTIRATDGNGCFVERPYTIVIAAAPVPPPPCPTITISPATLANARVGVAVSQTITGSGGTGPYSFGVTNGALPAGVTLTPAGVLAGTPTTLGTSTFTIRGTDANGCFAERAFTVTIIAAVPTLPQVFAVLLALALAGIGYLRLRRRAGAA